MNELSLHILDIAMNAIEAQATRIIIWVEESLDNNIFRIRVRDNGCGMSAELLEKVTDPFTTTRKTRTVGFGIALLKQETEKAEGSFDIQSQPGIGTELMASFKHDHINRPPLGDIASSIINLAFTSLDVHIGYLHKTDIGHFWFDSYWILTRMDEDDIFIYKLTEPTRSYINDGLKRISKD
jgi:anti-sigma regulatory factor (Ser/Thr protein kinase)